APSSKAYGSVSVLVELTARRTGFHPVSRTVFRPPPNVDSALVAFRRVDAPGNLADVRRVVEGAFSHRRKTLANALELAGVAARGRSVAALTTIGRPGDVRAEALVPADEADPGGRGSRWRKLGRREGSPARQRDACRSASRRSSARARGDDRRGCAVLPRQRPAAGRGGRSRARAARAAAGLRGAP